MFHTYVKPECSFAGRRMTKKHISLDFFFLIWFLQPLRAQQNCDLPSFHPLHHKAPQLAVGTLRTSGSNHLNCSWENECSNAFNHLPRVIQLADGSVGLKAQVLWCLICKEIQPVHSEGDQPWVFFGRNDAKAEAPVLWPPHAKSWLIGKDSDAGRDWGQEEKGMTEDEMAGWHHRLDGHEFE